MNDRTQIMGFGAHYWSCTRYLYYCCIYYYNVLYCTNVPYEYATALL